MIITLCGSMKFEQAFKEWNERLTMAGHICFTVSVYPSDKDNNKDWYTPQQKARLDQAHKEKIVASQAVLVINPGAYIGESTAQEIACARFHKKIVLFTCPTQDMAYNERMICSHQGCFDPISNRPPCALCYE